MGKTDQAVVLEEHFASRAFSDEYGVVGPPSLFLGDRQKRIDELDLDGIDVQVLSHAPGAAQALEPQLSVLWSSRINDELAEWIDGSRRFGGFAALPMADPEGAVRELDRAVNELGFCGAMIHGQTGGTMPDDPCYHDLFGMAEALGVPIYIHPGFPQADVSALYYDAYAERFPMFRMAAAGFTCETMVIAMRLMLGEITNLFPDLHLILGHLGEGIPFLLERIDESLARDNDGERFFKERFLRHFAVTTSGNFSDAALACTLAELGPERVLFSVDWPYCDTRKAREWIDGADLSPQDRHAVLRGNAERLLNLSA